jgi:lysophospholipase L1-like esterase
MKFPSFLATILAATHLLQAEIPVKPGDKVAFLGDSITQGGQSSPGGYVQLVGSGLAANGVKIEIIGAGISGHKSNQMLERLERDVLSKNPQWMTLSCGVNDVWHGDKGVPLEDYKKNITSIVDKAQAAGIKVVILTSTMIGEDQPNPNNQKLVGYNECLRTLAAEKKCLLADLNAEMQSALAEAAKAQVKPNKGNLLTTDGVHMGPAGNQMMAVGVLKGFGLNAAEIAKAKDAWLDIPNTSNATVRMGLTQRQSQQLEKLAAARNTTVDKLLNEEFTQLVNSLLKPNNR